MCVPVSSSVKPCRPERVQLYQHWADTLAIEWGSDINELVTELEKKQKQLKELYDRASLQVGSQRVRTHSAAEPQQSTWTINP